MQNSVRVHAYIEPQTASSPASPGNLITHARVNSVPRCRTERFNTSFVSPRLYNWQYLDIRYHIRILLPIDRKSELFVILIYFTHF